MCSRATREDGFTVRRRVGVERWSRGVQCGFTAFSYSAQAGGGRTMGSGGGTLWVYSILVQYADGWGSNDGVEGGGYSVVFTAFS